MFQNFKNFIRHGKNGGSKHGSKTKDKLTPAVSDNSVVNTKSHESQDSQPSQFDSNANSQVNSKGNSNGNASQGHAKYDTAVRKIIDEENESRSKKPSYPGLENYEIIEKMGDGAFSHVYKALDLRTKELRAIKVVAKHNLTSNQRASVLKEAAIMRQLDHPSVVRMYDFLETPDHFFIVLELVGGGELFHEIVRLTYFSEDLSRHVIVQVANAIRYLHEEAGVVHRDIKPENLLFTRGPFIPSKTPKVRPGDDEHKEDEGEFVPGSGAGGIGVIKLADFGLSKIIWDSKTMTPCGTVGYTAPEIVKDERYSKSVDMWAFGCVLYTILCGFPPFFDESIEVLTRKVAKGEYSFLSPWWDGISDSAKDLVSKLLIVDPEKRYSIEDFFNHPWVTQNTEQAIKTSDFRAHLPTTNMPSTPMHERGVRELGMSGALKDAFDVSNAVYRLEQEMARRNKAPRNVAILEEEEEDNVNSKLDNLSLDASKNESNSNSQNTAAMNLEKSVQESSEGDGYFDLHLEGSTLLERRKARKGSD